MRIDKIELYHAAMPLISPWRTAYGQDDAIETVLIAISSENETAWAETTPLALPCYSAEWAGGVFALLRDVLAPIVVGREIDQPEDLTKLLMHFKGNPFAKAGLDNAWWVLDAKLKNQPLHAKLGATRSTVAVGADFGAADSIDALLAQIQEAVDDRFARVKLKYRPGWDLEMLTAVRKTFPDLTLHIDCNNAYTLADVDMFKQVDKLGLAMIEQPLSSDDLVDHAKLQQQLETPICLDESISSPQRMRQAIELGSCRYVNIKPGRVGGLTASLDIYQQCIDANIGLWVGGMLESAVGSRVCQALAMLDGFDYPPDIFPTERFYAQDLSQPAVKLVRDAQGRPAIEVDDTPGINASPDMLMLEKCTMQCATLEA